MAGQSPITALTLEPDYTGDIAIVQSSNFSTLFILSRKQHLEDGVIDVRRRLYRSAPSDS